MNRLYKYSITAAALGAASLTPFSSALAQDTTVVVPAERPAAAPVIVNQPAARPVAVGPTQDVVEEETVPNKGLIISGAVMLGITYGSSVIVASSSSNDADRHLFVPIVGPWIDLADREDCSVRSSGCDAETANKVLLVADGIFQGVGVAQIVGGFLFPSKRVVQRTASVTVSPTVGLGQYGLTAFGSF